MQRVCSGERDAMSVLVRRLADQLITFLRRLGLNPTTAEETFQEVFFAVWKHRRRYLPSRRFKPWVLGIAANKGREALRRRPPERLQDDDPRWTGAKAGSEPVELLIQSETNRIVETGIARLPVKQREVVVMRLFNDMPYEEIALALNRSESTVRTHMSLGLTALREYLEPRLQTND